MIQHFRCRQVQFQLRSDYRVKTCRGWKSQYFFQMSRSFENTFMHCSWASVAHTLQSTSPPPTPSAPLPPPLDISFNAALSNCNFERGKDGGVTITLACLKVFCRNMKKVITGQKDKVRERVETAREREREREREWERGETARERKRERERQLEREREWERQLDRERERERQLERERERERDS